MSGFTRKLILGITTNLLIYGVLLLVPAWTIIGGGPGFFWG